MPHRRRSHVSILPADLSREPRRHYQRSDCAAILSGIRTQRDQADLEALADAGWLYAFTESDRPRQRRHIAELPDQREWPRHRYSKLRPAELVQVDGKLHP